MEPTSAWKWLGSIQAVDAFARICAICLVAIFAALVLASPWIIKQHRKFGK